ncbi:MAG: sigma-70 family RNA polymerase sigma factor [Bacteroidota bacterium]
MKKNQDVDQKLRDLLQEGKNGTEDLLNEILNHHRDECMRYIMSIDRTLKTDEVEDIFVESLFALETQIRKKEINSIIGYLKKICKNRTIDKTKIRQRLPLSALLSEHQDIEDIHLISSFELPVKVAQTAWELFRKLDEKCQKVLMLKFYQECSYKEIAEETDMAESSVGKKIQRCEKGIKELLLENPITKKHVKTKR